MNYIYSHMVCAFRANAIFYTVVFGPYTGVRVSMSYYLNIQDSKPCIYFLSIDYVDYGSILDCSIFRYYS